MSEFQQYQFKVIDKPLTKKQRTEIESLSSRSVVTDTSASFVYHYGDFRGDVLSLMTNYFDAMSYVANWGTTRLMFRFPRKLINEKALLQFKTDDEESSLNFHKTKDYLIFDLSIYEEDGDRWIMEDEYNLSNLISLRNDIINGDYRMLFLAWLSIHQHKLLWEEEELADENVAELTSPPIPPNLKKINGALQNFTHWFNIDQDLIAAAAMNSKEVKTEKVNYKKLLTKLDAKEKENYLIGFLDEEPGLQIKFKRHLDSFLPDIPNNEIPRVSFLELIKVSKSNEHKRKIKEEKAKEKAYEKKMQELSANEEELWKSVDFHLARKTPKSYDAATALLTDLHNLFVFYNNKNTFELHMENILREYGKAAAFLRRLRAAKLIDDE